MSDGAFTREELTDFFRIMLENMNRECGKVGFRLESLDVDYGGSIARAGSTPVLQTGTDGLSLKFSFKPVILMKEGETVG